MKKQAILVTLLCLSGTHLVAQAGKLSDWQQLIQKAECVQARTLCKQYENSSILAERVDAQKCMANVALCGNDTIMLEGNDNGGGSIHGGFKPEAVNEALDHLEIGLQLAPQDLSIHQGRLHVLEEAGRYNAMVKALEESASTYKGDDALSAWMAYSAELFEMGQFSADLELTKVIDKHFPDNADVIANIGALLSASKQPKEAIPYLERAVQLAPKDPINAWDLARAYDHAGETDKAEIWYQKALPLAVEPEQKKNMHCFYAEFVEKKLKDLPRACLLEKADCTTERQTACKPEPASGSAIDKR